MISQSPKTAVGCPSSPTESLQLPIRPGVGLWSVVIGTVWAIMTVPEDVYSPNSLFLPALSLSLGLAVGPVAAALRDPRAILRVENVIGLSPIFWLLLEPLQGLNDLGRIAEREQVVTVFLAIGLFTSGMWLACLHSSWNIPAVFRESLTVNVNHRVLFSVTVVAFGLGMLRFAVACNFNILTMFYCLGLMRWATPWGRGLLGGWGAFLEHSTYFGYLLPTLAVLLARQIGWMHRRMLLVLVMTFIMSLFLMQGGGRRIIGVTIGAAVVTYVLSVRHLRIQTIILSLVSTLALLWVTSTMLEYRRSGFAGLFDREAVVSSAARKSGAFYVDNNIRSFSEGVYFIPSKHPYVYHRYFIWVLARPIPRVLWPGKPVDFGFSLPEAAGYHGVSLSTTVIGELYFSGGLLMVLFGGWLYGRLAGMANTLLKPSRTTGSLLSYGIALLALFAGMRSGIDLILMAYPLLAWSVLLWFARTTGMGTAKYMPPPVTQR